jgi:hypothetical protein
MSELKPSVPTPSESMTIVGPTNFAPPANPFQVVPTYESMSYTVTASATMMLPVETGNRVEGAPSQPLSPGAVRVVNSVLNARVPDSAIERD